MSEIAISVQSTEFIDNRIVRQFVSAILSLYKKHKSTCCTPKDLPFAPCMSCRWWNSREEQDEYIDGASNMCIIITSLSSSLELAQAKVDTSSSPMLQRRF